MSLTASDLTRRLLALTFPPLSINRRLLYLLCVGSLIILGTAIAWLSLTEVALLLGGAIFLILLLIEPLLSLYVLIPLIPFSSLFTVSAGGARVGLMEIILFLGVAAWLLQISVKPDQNIPRPPLLWPFLLMLAAVSLSWLNTLSLGASLVETIKWVEMLVLYLMVVALLPVGQVKWLVSVILLTGMAQAILGLYQFIFRVGPEGFLLFGGRFLRAYGTFAQPNPYAGYLGLILPLALAVAIWGLIDFDPRSTPRLSILRSGILRLVLFGLPFGIMLVALFATQSRSAWLGFFAAATVVFAIYNKRTMTVLVSIILLATVVALVGAFNLGLTQITTSYGVIIQRLVEAGSIFTINDISSIEVTDANFATVERLAHWRAAQEMWRDNPWLGVGFGNYAVVYPAYAVGRWLDPLGHAHNYLLNIGAEAGLVGITTYLIFWIFTFGVLWQTVRRSHGFERAVSVGVVGIMVHLQIHNFFDNLYVQGMYLYIAIVLAVASVVYHCSQVEETSCQC